MSWKLKLLAILNVLGWVVVVPLLTAALLNPFVEFKDWPGDFLLDHPASEARLPQEPAPNASPKPAVRDHGRSAAPAAAALVVPHLLVPVPVGNQIVKVPVAGPAPRTGGGGGGATPVPGTPQRQPASNQPPGVVSPPPVQPPASGPPSEIPQAPPATPVEVPIRPGTATAVDETPAGDDSPPAKGHGHAKKPKKPKGNNGRHLGQLKPHARAVPATPAVPGHPTIPAVPATPASAVKRPAKVRKARQAPAPAPAPAPRPRKPKKQVVVPAGVKPKAIHVAPDDDSPAPVGPPPGPPGPPPGAPGNGNGNGHAYGHFK